MMHHAVAIHSHMHHATTVIVFTWCILLVQLRLRKLKYFAVISKTNHNNVLVSDLRLVRLSVVSSMNQNEANGKLLSSCLQLNIQGDDIG
jgi:hypothetical protein